MEAVLELDERPGGTNTSHTIAVDLLRALLAAVPAGAGHEQYKRVAVDDNGLGKATQAGRARTFRYLRELYLLDPNRLLFRALRDLWDEDDDAQPLLACLTALVRDASMRASGTAVLPVAAGSPVPSAALAAAVAARFPGAYNPETAAKIGRNTASSWTQSGHLLGRAAKVRVRARAGPVSMSLALLIGHLQGLRGDGLFGSPWVEVLDVSPHEAHDITIQASRQGYLELKSAGGVVELGFRHLLRRPIESVT